MEKVKKFLKKVIVTITYIIVNILPIVSVFDKKLKEIKDSLK